MTLTPDEVTRLRSMHDRLDMAEVEDIYLPMSRLLSMYVAATQRLFRAQSRFLGTGDAKMPYIIGIGGSVAVGKSTTSRVLQALLARWPNVPKVDLVTTDGFLFPNEVLEREGLMQKKGFPESYDQPALLSFLSDIKSGRRPDEAYTLDEDYRKDLFCQMAQILEDELPGALLFTAVNADAHSTRLQGVQSTTNDIVTWNAADWTLSQ